MPKIKLLIFDWDDVFTLGSKEGYFACYHETLVELGINLNSNEERKRILEKWGQPHQEELKELLKEYPELLDRACSVYEDKLFGNIFVDHLTLISGAIELLERLHKKYILAVATGLNPKIMREQVVPKFKIPDVFSQIISTYEIEDPKKHKPSPYIAEKLLKVNNILPSEAVVVGDSKNDVLMAQRANIVPIVVLSGHLNENEALRLGVTHIVEDVTCIENVLHELEHSSVSL